MIKSESTFKTFVINGNLDEEFEENTADGGKNKIFVYNGRRKTGPCAEMGR